MHYRNDGVPRYFLVTFCTPDGLNPRRLERQTVCAPDAVRLLLSIIRLQLKKESSFCQTKPVALISVPNISSIILVTHVGMVPPNWH